MPRSIALLGLLASSLVSAIPLDERTVNVCPAVDFVVAILHAYPSASPFCSSFLGIKTATATKTVAFTSPVTTTLPTITTTVYIAAETPVTVWSSS